MHTSYPELLFIDATYNNYRMPLYVMAVEDSLGETHVISNSNITGVRSQADLIC